MYKKVIFLFLIFFLSNCTSMRDLVGTYTSESDKTMIMQILVLKKDSTFIYSLTGDLIDTKSRGSWFISQRRYLILKSDESIRPGVIESKEELVPRRKITRLKIVDEFNHPLAYASVMVNQDSLKGFTINQSGEAEYSLETANSIRISYLGSTYEYNVKNSSANSIFLKIRLEQESRIFLDSEEWEVSGKKLTNINETVLIKKK